MTATLPGMASVSSSAHQAWTFLSNHAHVLIVLARQPDLRMRDVAERVGVSERAVQRIVADLVSGGCLEAIRVGRRNHYRIHEDVRLRHPIEAHHTIGELIVLGR